YGGSNVIAVRADATMEEGWYYEGAGIYRHVWLSKHDPLHVAPNGTFVTTKVAGTSAQVQALARISNESPTGKLFTVVQIITDPEGKQVARGSKEKISLSPFKDLETTISLTVNDAKLWDLENPNLYKLSTTIIEGST